MNKKLLVAALCLLPAFALTGCKKEEPPKAADTAKKVDDAAKTADEAAKKAADDAAKKVDDATKAPEKK